VASFYKPLLIGINIVYVILQYTLGAGFANLGLSDYLAILAILALQMYAYIGILDSAAHHHKTSDKSLVGGSNLDLLAITCVIQFGTLLISRKFYYLLALVPVWAACSLYKTFFGGKDSNKAGTAAADAAGDDSKQTERRQKRAERRRQKWS